MSQENIEDKSDPFQSALADLIALYKLEEFQQVSDYGELLVKDFINSFYLWNLLGATNLQLCKPKKAEISFYAASQIQPNNPDVYNNLGIALQEQGKLEDAVKAFKKALNITPDSATIYNNLGNIFKRLGNSKQAVSAYDQAISFDVNFVEAYCNKAKTLCGQGKFKKSLETCDHAISLKPDFAEAFNNRGMSLRGLGKLEDALDAYDRAIFFKEDFAEAFYNKGVAFKEIGKPIEALAAYDRAIFFKEDFAEAHNNKGIIFQESGKYGAAASAFNKAILINNDFTEAYKNLGISLKGIKFTVPKPELHFSILKLLENEMFIRPSDIAGATVSLIKLDPAVRNILGSVKKISQNSTLIEIISVLSKKPLLLKLMSVCPIPDKELEILLNEIRSRIVNNISFISNKIDVINFQKALAFQCFINEFIYQETDLDLEALKALERSIEINFLHSKQINTSEILCLASFKPLRFYAKYKNSLSSKHLQKILKVQMSDYFEEKELSSKIPVLKDISDHTSLKVREQYEENPYPRWASTSIQVKSITTNELAQQFKLKISKKASKIAENPKILIAGCGTGQHAIFTASRFKNSEVLAVDLSLSSLAYAKRKTQEFGIKNIKYMQADILDLASLGEKFDIIESAGVLHHMEKPYNGLSVLVDCLSSGGLIKIGLYSELARNGIAEIRDEIKLNYKSEEFSHVKTLRQKLFYSEQPHHKAILNSPDFYSSSSIRDLLFHVQEHHFTLYQIEEFLFNLGLLFCGFEDSKILDKFRLENTSKNDLYDLNKWNEFEKYHQNIFAGMYQFWCQKT
ncbi:tetratricopeptide repeat protein [Alphaproteobacteria bacterium]|nr:tetratricopeptide repeat protein [Alphaproteobacteria bacterium]